MISSCSRHAEASLRALSGPLSQPLADALFLPVRSARRRAVEREAIGPRSARYFDDDENAYFRTPSTKTEFASRN